MIHPVKSLFFQLYWWQDRHGHKGEPLPASLSFFSICIQLYVFALVMFFYEVVIHFSFVIELLRTITVLLILYLLFIVLYKKEYKNILKDRRYHTRTQRIMAIVFGVGAFLSCLVTIIFLVALQDKIIKLDLPLIK